MLYRKTFIIKPCCVGICNMRLLAENEYGLYMGWGGSEWLVCNRMISHTINNKLILANLKHKLNLPFGVTNFYALILFVEFLVALQTVRLHPLINKRENFKMLFKYFSYDVLTLIMHIIMAHFCRPSAWLVLIPWLIP